MCMGVQVISKVGFTDNGFYPHKDSFLMPLLHYSNMHVYNKLNFILCVAFLLLRHCLFYIYSNTCQL